MRIAEKGRIDMFLLAGLVLAIAGGSFLSFRSSGPVNPAELAEAFSISIGRELSLLDAVADDIVGRWDKSRTIALQKAGAVDFFSGSGQEIDAWTGNQFLPPGRMLLGDFRLKHVRTGAGDFLLRKWMMDESRYLAAIVPLHIHYKIQNEYLEPSWNEALFNGYHVEIFDASSLQGLAISLDGEVLFRFAVSGGYARDDVAAVTLIVIAIALFIVLFLRWTKGIYARQPALHFLLLSGVLFSVRYAMIAGSFPAQFIRSDFFDPAYFASSELNPSMGDLLINSVLVTFLCFVLFRNFFRFERLRDILRSSRLNWILSSVAVVAVLFGFLFPFH
jgi:two-component system nitrogen regulation sensor histidine kinase NtrY